MPRACTTRFGELSHLRLYLGYCHPLPAPLSSSRSSTATIAAIVIPFVLPSCAVLVCATCPVSVSVRLPCLSMARTTRDAGHHSRFVHWLCFLPALHGRLWLGIGVRTWGHVTTTEGRLPGACRGVVMSTRDGSDDGDHSACEHASAGERGQPHHDRLRRSTTELLGTSGTDERVGSPRQPRCRAMPQASLRSQTPDSCSARAGSRSLTQAARTATALPPHHHFDLQPFGAGLQEMWPVWAVRDAHRSG
jgi:hypothetical protein